MFLVRMKKNSKLRHMGNLDGKDVCFWMLAKCSTAKMRAKSLIVVYKGTVLAAETKSYYVSLPCNMNNKNSDCKLVSSFPKNIYLPEKNALGVNLRF